MGVVASAVELGWIEFQSGVSADWLCDILHHSRLLKTDLDIDLDATEENCLRVKANCVHDEISIRLYFNEYLKNKIPPETWQEILTEIA